MTFDIQDSLKRTWENIVPSIAKTCFLVIVSLLIFDFPILKNNLDSNAIADTLLNEKLIKILNVYGIATLMPFITLSLLLFLCYAVSQIGLIIGRVIPIHFSHNTTFELLHDVSPWTLARLVTYFPKKDNQFESINLINHLVEEKITLATLDAKSHPLYKDAVYSKVLFDLNTDRFIFSKFLFLWAIAAYVAGAFYGLTVSTPGFLLALFLILITLVLLTLNARQCSTRYNKNKLSALQLELESQFIKPTQPAESTYDNRMQQFAERIKDHIQHDEPALAVEIFGKKFSLTKIKKK